MTLDVVIESALWDGTDLDRLAGKAEAAVMDRLGIEPSLCEGALLACDDARIAELNADFRGRARATNVLSWPAEERGATTPGEMPLALRPDPTGAIELGDMALAYETCAAEAREQGKPFEAHLTHLIVHGLLHLMGFDHERDPDATLMEGLETEILGQMGLPDPYGMDDHGRSAAREGDDVHTD